MSRALPAQRGDAFQAPIHLALERKGVQACLFADFLGYNANAVKWQVWMVLVTYLLLRFCAFVGQWPHSFTRLFTLVRSALWRKLDLRGLLEA